MSRYRLSPMAAPGGVSPMSVNFQGYIGDHDFPVERSFQMHDVAPGAADTAAHAPLEPAEPARGAPQDGEALQTEEPTAEQLDELADVTYELDASGNVVAGSIAVPDEDTPSRPQEAPPSKPAKPARKSAAKTTGPKAANTRSKTNKPSRTRKS